MSTSKGNDENVGDSAQASDEGLLLVPPKRRDSTIWRARRGTKATKFDFYSPEDIERAAEYLGLTSEELRAAVDEFERADHIEPTSPLFLAVVRSESDVDSLSDQFEDADVRVVMRSVLEHDISDFNKPIVSWSDIEACCALDLDCPPGGVPLTDDELESIIDAFYLPTLRENRHVHGYACDGYWADLGTVASYEAVCEEIGRQALQNFEPLSMSPTRVP